MYMLKLALGCVVTETFVITGHLPDTSKSNGSLWYSKLSLVNEQVSVPLSVVLKSLTLIVCSIVISAKHPFEHFQVNSLLAGGAGVTEHVRLRLDPIKYSTAL